MFKLTNFLHVNSRICIVTAKFSFIKIRAKRARALFCGKGFFFYIFAILALLLGFLQNWILQSQYMFLRSHAKEHRWQGTVPIHNGNPKTLIRFNNVEENVVFLAWKAFISVSKLSVWCVVQWDTSTVRFKNKETSDSEE